MSNAALAEGHSPPGTDGCSDTKANSALKWCRLTIYKPTHLISSTL